MFVYYGYQAESQDQEDRQALAQAIGLRPTEIAQNQPGRLRHRQFLRLLGQGLGLAAPLVLGMLPILGLLAVRALILISGGILWHYLPLRSWLSPSKLYAGCHGGGGSSRCSSVSPAGWVTPFRVLSGSCA